MRAVDLFRGAGGWSLAARRLGIEDLGVEIMPEANATAEAAGFRTFAHDVWTMNSVPETQGLIASPPCQTFSQAGKGEGRKALDEVLRMIERRTFINRDRLRATPGDERTALVLMPLYYIYRGVYSWVALEQVPTVLPVWEAYAEVMRDWGYYVWTGLLHAEQYGVPQTRKRAFLIASLDRVVRPPEPTHSRYYPRNPEKLDPDVKKWVSMAEALGWGAKDLVLRNNNTANAAERELDAPAPTLYFGQRSNYCAWEQRPEGNERPDWVFNRPSTTIVGSFKPEVVAAPGYRTTVPRQNAENSVRVTVQEAGILQSFPADYPWQGSKSKQYLQVGNAVPPLLAEAVLSKVVSG